MRIKVGCNEILNANVHFDLHQIKDDIYSRKYIFAVLRWKFSNILIGIILVIASNHDTLFALCMSDTKLVDRIASFDVSSSTIWVRDN